MEEMIFAFVEGDKNDEKKFSSSCQIIIIKK